MGIPTKYDRRLAEIETLGNMVTFTLKTLHYGDPARRDGRILRERLQDYCDAVVETCNQVLADEI
jgi:hypothetical protein